MRVVSCVVASLLLATPLSATSTSRGGGTGTPSWAPASFDCAVRRAAWEYGKATLPQRGSFRTLFDAMQLGALCGDTPPVELDRWSPPTFPTPAKAVLYCDAAAAPSSGDGSQSHPFASLAEAVQAAARMPGSTIVLRGGVYHERTLALGPEHSGLTIQVRNATFCAIIVYTNILPRQARDKHRENSKRESRFA
jgi:hypothetical protein